MIFFSLIYGETKERGNNESIDFSTDHRQYVFCRSANRSCIDAVCNGIADYNDGSQIRKGETMNFLNQSLIERKGDLIHKNRRDRLTVDYIYHYNGKGYTFPKFEPSDYAISLDPELAYATNLKQEKGNAMKKSLFGKTESAATPANNRLSGRLSAKKPTTPAMSSEGLIVARELTQQVQVIKAEVSASNQTVLDNFAKVLAKIDAIAVRQDAMQKLLAGLQAAQTPSATVSTNKSIDKTAAINSGSLINSFASLYTGKLAGGNLGDEKYQDAFDILASAGSKSNDYKSFESAISSIWTEYRESENVFLYAAKNKQKVIQALWQAMQDTESDTTPKRDNGAATSPVYSLDYFAKSLQIDKKHLQTLINDIEELDCFGDAEEEEIVNFLIEHDAQAPDSALDTFIEFVRDSFN